jgi:LemA protein
MHPGPGPIGEPRRSGAAWILIPLVLAIAGAMTAGLWLHNGLVAKREAVDAAWADVESQYRRRADMVPLLVQAVKRHMQHESETFERVVRARSEALEQFSRVGGSAPASESELRDLAASQARMGQQIHQVLALAESYPTLRSADQFLELQAQLEGTENRINVARLAFNEAVRRYNAALEQIPTRYLAEARGYQRRSYFETDESARHAASLAFD